MPPGQRLAGWTVTQEVEGGTLLWGGPKPPYSVTPRSFEPGEVPSDRLTGYELAVSERHFENFAARIELNEAGDISRIYDKRQKREVLPPGVVANQFQAFEDRPLNWDAWDIDLFYDERMYLAEPAESIRVVEAGPLRATIEIKRRILNSTYTQRVSLAFNSPSLDIETVINWRERHVLLKVAFPVDILSPTARYEVQWGHVERPTHHNTSWDWARFETCGHKWVDLSEGGYGVALINDCKYGHDVKDNVIRLSLLRSPTEPDPEADQGEHRFAYRLFPHSGDEAEGLRTVAAEAYAFNNPVRVRRRSSGETKAAAEAEEQRYNSGLAHGSPNLVIETVKPAEDGRGLIVRFYEHLRQRGPIELWLGFPVREAWRTNLLEEDEERLEIDGAFARLMVTPFEIVTVRVIPA
jgi:alpha-mannosidase